MALPSVLFVDDDWHLLESSAEWLRGLGYQVSTAHQYQAACQLLRQKLFDLAIVDVHLDEADGFRLLEHCQQCEPPVPVILISGFASVPVSIRALRAGATDLLTKPFVDDDLQQAIERILQRQQVTKQNRKLREELQRRCELPGIIGQSLAMQNIADLVQRVADSRTSVLVTGESGTGKSMLARAIHQQSSRRKHPFVEVACGALSETLLESELFGHQQGAFTGATQDRMGRFQQADKGTIFLDEIATATPALQVKLLRVLQEFQFEPVGGTQTLSVDTRVILATNEDLTQLVDEGRFRQDLYYRINVVNIELPPLRDRTEDIAPLAMCFLKKFASSAGKSDLKLSPAALKALENYHWPGNVRELENAIERASLLCREEYIDLTDLPESVLEGDSSESGNPSLKQALQRPERDLILETLEKQGWNRTQTAEALGINRTTLYKKMKKFGLLPSRRSVSR